MKGKRLTEEQIIQLLHEATGRTVSGGCMPQAQLLRAVVLLMKAEVWWPGDPGGEAASRT
jgi:hypothetical protein